MSINTSKTQAWALGKTKGNKSAPALIQAVMVNTMN